MRIWGTLIVITTCVALHGIDSTSFTEEMKTNFINVINAERQSLGGADLLTVCWDDEMEPRVMEYAKECTPSLSVVEEGTVVRLESFGGQGYWQSTMELKDTNDLTMSSCVLNEACSLYKHFIVNKLDKIACALSDCGYSVESFFCLIRTDQTFANGEAAFTPGPACSSCPTQGAGSCTNLLCTNSQCEAPFIQTEAAPSGPEEPEQLTGGFTNEMKTDFIDTINSERQTLGGSDLLTVCWDNEMEPRVIEYAKDCTPSLSVVDEGTIVRLESFGGQSYWESTLGLKDTVDLTMSSCVLDNACSMYKHLIVNKVDKVSCAMSDCGFTAESFFCLIRKDQTFANGEDAFTPGTACSSCPTQGAGSCTNLLCTNSQCEAPFIQTEAAPSGPEEHVPEQETVDNAEQLTEAQKTELVYLINSERQTHGASNMKTVCWDKDLQSAAEDKGSQCLANLEITEVGALIREEVDAGLEIANFWNRILTRKDAVNPTMVTCNRNQDCATYKYFIFADLERVGCSFSQCGSPKKTFMFCAFAQTFPDDSPAYTGGTACSGCPTTDADNCTNALCTNPLCTAPIFQTEPGTPGEISSPGDTEPASTTTNTLVTLDEQMKTDFVNSINTERQNLSAADMGTVCWDNSLESTVTTYANQCVASLHVATEGTVIMIPQPAGDLVFWDSIVSLKNITDRTMTDCNQDEDCANYKHFITSKLERVACVISECGTPLTQRLFCLIPTEYVFSNGEPAFTVGDACSGCPSTGPDGCTNHLCTNALCTAPPIAMEDANNGNSNMMSDRMFPERPMKWSDDDSYGMLRNGSNFLINILYTGSGTNAVHSCASLVVGSVVLFTGDILLW